MQLAVAVEKMGANGYRAKGGEPLGLCAEGSTRDEALANLRAKIVERLAAGVEIVTLDIPVGTSDVRIEEHPLARFAGTLDPNDPIVQDWFQIMAENRLKEEETIDVP
jgi:hypothetical protein